MDCKINLYNMAGKIRVTEHMRKEEWWKMYKGANCFI